MAVQHAGPSSKFAILVLLLLSSKADQVDRDLQSATNNITSKDVPLSQYMWDQTEALRQSILQTSFVKGIGDGTLNPTAFGAYNIQDAVYIYMAKKSIDIAAERATQGDLKKFLIKKSTDYEGYYKDMFKQWHIDNATAIQLGDACKAYADYERSVASDMDTIYFIISMIPCMKLWPWLGGQLQEKDHGVYKKWSSANFDPNYTGYKELDTFVDSFYQLGAINDERAIEVYTRCMEGEFAFFDSPEDIRPVATAGARGDLAPPQILGITFLLLLSIPKFFST